MKTAKFHEVAILAVDSQNGIYSAQILNERFNLDIPQEDKDILTAGPDDEQYMDVWAELDEATCEDGKYTIYQLDGDIWLVPSDVEITNWEELQ